VEEFRRNGTIVPPLTTDTTRWKRVFISSMTNGGYPGGGSSVELMNDSLRNQAIIADTNTRQIIIAPMVKLDSSEMQPGRMYRVDRDIQSVLSYTPLGKDSLAVIGKLGGDSIHMVWRRIDHTKMLLVRRGFHWINEYVCCE
jgi:hypothetical protein